jgi:hypothetical protein
LNNQSGLKTVISNWLGLFPFPLGRGKRGRVLASSGPLPDPLPRGEGDKIRLQNVAECSISHLLHFKLESTIYHFSFAIAGHAGRLESGAVGKKEWFSMKNGKMINGKW